MRASDRFFDTSVSRAVPWHSDCRDTYFTGNSVVGASGTPEGEWTFVIGPDYTSPNYISSERLYLICDGKRLDIELNMKRLRRSGVFFGNAEADGMRVSVWDFAPPDTSAAVRYICVDDMRGKGRSARVCAEITPFECAAEIRDGMACIVKDTSCYCFGNHETLNWAERRCRIGFVPWGNAENDGERCVLHTELSDGGDCALVHVCSYEDDCGPVLENPADMLERTFDYWEGWLAAGNMPATDDVRYADALESLLLCVKMQQNRDGGFIAGIRKYANSYVRDTHGAMRFLLATGHSDEVKRLILNIHGRWQRSGFIPNWWSMGSDSFIGHSFHNDAAEVTAYYIFMIRDLFRHTGDRDFVNQVAPSLQWAAQTQLDWLRAHGYTMDFNGDETEQYCCNNDGEEYGGFVQPGYEWDSRAISFPSMAAALCSLEWYAEYSGWDIAGDMEKLRGMIDEIFLDHDTGTHNWSARRHESGWTPHKGRLTNYMLLPVWMGARLSQGRETADALAVKSFLRQSGFLPNCPEVMPGFCGHTMGLFLYDMLLLGQKEAADAAVHTILDSQLLSMYGTVSEFYGPSCIPNGHNCRSFEGGIVGEALTRYFGKA